MLGDTRKNAVVIGPGNGVGQLTRERAIVALRGNASVVLDADALTSFAEAPDELFEHSRDGVVMTPHEGKFVRIFPGRRDATPRPGRLEAARLAARRTNAVVVIKGP